MNLSLASVSERIGAKRFEENNGNIVFSLNDMEIKKSHKWNKYNVEVVFVSLDTDQETFNNFAEGFPFISTCDYQKWESPVVQSYHVFVTPTIYLLDDKREILLRPNSVKQLDSWVDWFLVQRVQRTPCPTASFRRAIR